MICNKIILWISWFIFFHALSFIQDKSDVADLVGCHRLLIIVWQPPSSLPVCERHSLWLCGGLPRTADKHLGNVWSDRWTTPTTAIFTTLYSLRHVLNEWMREHEKSQESRSLYQSTVVVFSKSHCYEYEC